MKPIRFILPLMAAVLLSPAAVQAKQPHHSRPSAGMATNAAIAAAIAAPTRAEANRKQDIDRMPAAVLAFTAIRQGDTVADFQAGGGYYSELFASLVGPRGKVLALVATQYFKADPWTPITAAHSNITLQTLPLAELKLAPASVNTIFTNTVFHDLYLGKMRDGSALPPPTEVLANWFAAIKPGGHVIIADHVGPAGDATEIANRLHRIDPAKVKADMALAGFVLQSESSVLHRNDDPHQLIVFDKSLRGHTDRFLFKFRRP